VQIYHGERSQASKRYQVKIIEIAPKSYAWRIYLGEDPVSILLLQCVWAETGQFYSDLLEVPTMYWTDATIAKFGDISNDYISTGIELGFTPIQSENGFLVGWA